MSSSTGNMNEAVRDYLLRTGVRDSDLKRRLRAETAGMPNGRMQICAEQGQLMALLRPGGLLGVDNALWGGRVADDADDSPATLAIREVNARIAADSRVTPAFLPIGDGLLLVRKR